MGALKSFVLPLGILLFSVVQCDEVEEGCQVLEFYRSPNYSSYKIENVALLPMLNDDTTDNGTFYSTNHFYNSLEEYNTFKLVDIDKISASDSNSIDNLLISIRDSLKINVDSFYTTDLGKFLKHTNCDVIILGNIYEYEHYNSTTMKYGRLYLENITRSNFNYFMISLLDGSVLWAANVDGKSRYVFEVSNPNQNNPFPPLDVAISNGIDALLLKLRDEINLESK